MGPAIYFSKNTEYCTNFIITGNIFHRNGKQRKIPFVDKYENSHIYLNGVHNSAISSNTFSVAKDDGGGGIASLYYGIVCRNIDGTVISGNILKGGAIKEEIVILTSKRG
ncbi:MAG: hypothetical protein PHV07_05520 [Oscillospiraceae bacterium]|nr:hypothetical protein [Oscillospiraceae bacterium]